MTYLLLIIYLPICYWIMILILRRCKSKKEKVLMVPVVLFLLYLPLGWDVILGRGYFYYYCSAQGGVKIYDTIQIDSSHWDDEGKPKFITPSGGFDASVFGEKYSYIRTADRKFDKLFNIGRYSNYLLNVKSNKKLGEIISFVYFGGWFANYSGFSVSGDRCHGFSKGKSSGFYRDVSRYIFIPMEKL